MHIRLVKSDKKRFLDLLLLADEQESMIDRYIERGDLFVMEEKDEAKAVAVVTREGQGVYELKKREFEIKLENRQLPVIEQLDINGGLLFKKAVCCDS